MGTKCNCRQSKCETLDASRRPAEPLAAAFRLRFLKLRMSIFRVDLLVVPESADCIGPFRVRADAACGCTRRVGGANAPSAQASTHIIIHVP